MSTDTPTDTATDTATDTPTDTATDMDVVIDGYLAGWNTTDPTERGELVARHWAPDARMADPLVDVTGHADLIDVFARFHETYPGCSFRRRGTHDAHHGLVRWGWEMLDPGGSVLLTGMDVAVVADGRLSMVAGFFDAPAAG
jgi:hypothetical protein